jgi:hypothetical protein
MESVIIVAPHPYENEFRDRLSPKRLDPDLSLAQGEPDTFVVTDGRSRVYVSRNDSIRNELEAEELERISESIHEPIFYSFDFSDISLCHRVLEALVDDAALLVDNDHGVQLNGSAFVRLLRSRADWDWRRDPVPKH